MALLEDAGPAGPAGAQGLLTAMPALDTGAREFAQVYGAQGALLAALTAEASSRGDTGMAGLLSALEQALRDQTLEMAPAPKEAPRLTAYVYPVV